MAERLHGSEYRVRNQHKHRDGTLIAGRCALLEVIAEATERAVEMAPALLGHDPRLNSP